MEEQVANPSFKLPIDVPRCPHDPSGPLSPLTEEEGSLSQPVEETDQAVLGPTGSVGNECGIEVTNPQAVGTDDAPPNQGVKQK